MELDAVERILLHELDLLVQQDPSLRHHPLVLLDDGTGALSSQLITSGWQIRRIVDSYRIAQSHRAAGLPESSTKINAELLSGVRVVLLKLPRALEALEEAAWWVSRWADSEVVLLGGERERHLNRSMNTELERHFRSVRASLGRYKSRVLIASGAKHQDLDAVQPPRIPRCNAVKLAGKHVQLRALGRTFGAARLDPGTGLLLTTILEDPALRTRLDAADSVVDLGCGNGSVSAVLATQTAVGHLIASDDSWSAVESTQYTCHANTVSDRVEVVHADGLGHLADDSQSIVVLNPPFHDGTALTKTTAQFLFSEARRVLEPGGVLWCVWNSHLHYRPDLEKLVGPSRQLARDRRFTVTESHVV